jgi:hypothetical protein
MGFFGAIIRAVHNEYESRIRAASLVKEYGLHHHADGHGPTDGTHALAHAAPEAEEAEELPSSEDEGEVVISNVRPGTRMKNPSEPTASQ